MFTSINFDEYKRAVGQRIKIQRLKKNMKQAELATACDFEKASMSRIEAGKTNITIFTLHKISTVLGIDISLLLAD